MQVETIPLETSTQPEVTSWQKDLTNYQIPASPLHGMVNGQPFKLQQAQFSNRILRLKQLIDKSVDTEFVIALPMDKKESPDGLSFTVHPNDMLAHMPAVSLRYRETGDELPLGGNLYLNGFSMKLKFGQAKEGRVQVAVYLCLPDTRRSFIAGKFMARMVEDA